MVSCIICIFVLHINLPSRSKTQSYLLTTRLLNSRVNVFEIINPSGPAKLPDRKKTLESRPFPLVKMNLHIYYTIFGVCVNRVLYFLAGIYAFLLISPRLIFYLLAEAKVCVHPDLAIVPIHHDIQAVLLRIFRILCVKLVVTRIGLGRFKKSVWESTWILTKKVLCILCCLRRSSQ